MRIGGARCDGWRLGLACALALSCAPSGPRDETSSRPGRIGDEPGAAASLPATDRALDEMVSVYVVLHGPPAVGVPDRSLSAPLPAAAVGRRLGELRATQRELGARLQARGARIVAHLLRLANAIQVRVPRSALDSLVQLPGVKRIDPVSTFERELSSSVPAIGAPAVWAGDPSHTGSGVRIGIVDSGIDYTHADFAGPGTPDDYFGNDPTRIEPGSFPTLRVVGGWDFAGDDYDPADEDHADPVPDPDPLDCSRDESARDAAGHGTHVAGVAAGGGVLLDRSPFTGPYDQSFDPGTFRIYPGVAPEADLYAFKVFGCTGGTQLLAAALERAADPNEDGDLSDRLDVVNASVGTAYGLSSPVEAEIIANLVKLGTVVVAAGGNEGASFFTVDAPGTVPGALSVAASQVGEYLALRVDEPPEVAGSLPAAEADFTRPLVDIGTLTGTVAYAEPHDGCAALLNGAAIAGKIALVDRGVCPFVDKLEHVAAAGALAAIVVDDEDQELPIVMGGDREVAIAGVLVRQADGAQLRGALGAGLVVTLDGASFYEGLDHEIIADFSSRGPSAEGPLLKPELAAPGYSVDSAKVGTGSDWRRAQGTSVATPMVSGVAALVRQAHPTWSAAEIKAALMDTAVGLTTSRGEVFPVSRAGAGRVDAARAVASEVTLAADADDGTVGVSFGVLVADEPVEVTREIVARNRGAETVTYRAEAVADHALDGVRVTVTPEVVVLPGGGVASLSAELVFDPARLGVPPPDPLTPVLQEGLPRHYLNETSGHVVLSNATLGPPLRLPWYGVVRAAARRTAGRRVACVAARQRATVLQFLEGPSAHPDPVVSAFELGVLDPPRSGASADPTVALTDVRAVGVATNYRAAASLADSDLLFGLAIAGSWTTPARGSFHHVGVLLDTDGDDQADYWLVADPLSRDGPYADAMLAIAYDATTAQPLEPARYVNVVPAGELDTAPFDNSVVVLGVRAGTIGLTEQSPQLRYAGFARSRDASVADHETTAWATFDPTHPVLDPARRAVVPGQPIQDSASPVRVVVDLAAAGAEPLPDLLLLHHTNVATARWQAVPFDGLDQDALVLEHEATAVARPGGPLHATLTVENRTDLEQREVWLVGQLAGGSLERVESSAGACDPPGRLHCELGPVAPGARVTVQLDGRAASSLGLGEAAVLSVSMLAADGCDTDLELLMRVPTRPGWVASGGCSCRVAPSLPARARAAPAWLLLLLGGWLGHRRRRGDRPPCGTQTSVHSSSS